MKIAHLVPTGHSRARLDLVLHPEPIVDRGILYGISEDKRGAATAVVTAIERPESGLQP